MPRKLYREVILAPVPRSGGGGAAAEAAVSEDAGNTSVLGTDDLIYTPHDTDKVDVAGDTMTGALVLPGVPTLALQAATKSYVDAVTPPPITVGLWAPMYPHGSLSTVALTAGGLKLTRCVLRNSVKDVITEVTILGTGVTYRVGVYTDVSYAPGTLVTQTADMSGGTAAMVTGSLASTVPPGTYWIGIQNLHASTSVTLRSGGGHNPWLPGTGTPISASQHCAWSQSSQGTSLPDPYPGTVPTMTGLMPMVWLKSA